MIDEDYLKVPLSILTGRVCIHPHHTTYERQYGPCPGCIGKTRVGRISTKECSVQSITKDTVVYGPGYVDVGYPPTDPRCYSPRRDFPPIKGNTEPVEEKE